MSLITIHYKCGCSPPASAKSSKTPPASDAFQAMMTEYTSLREEAQHDDTHQIELVTIAFSTLTALIGAAAAFQDIIPPQAALFLSFVVLPCLTMFLGLLWIDLVYRRTRFAAYTRAMENKINLYLNSTGPADQRVVAWEHWLQTLKPIKGILPAPRFFRGYVLSGSWIVAPFLFAGAYFILSGQSFCQCVDEFKTLIHTHWLVSSFMALIGIIYYWLFSTYIREIRQLSKLDG